MTQKTDAIFMDGYEAARADIPWWHNPKPAGSAAAGEWDDGHTRWRRLKGVPMTTAERDEFRNAFYDANPKLLEY